MLLNFHQKFFKFGLTEFFDRTGIELSRSAAFEVDSLLGLVALHHVQHIVRLRYPAEFRLKIVKGGLACEVRAGVVNRILYEDGPELAEIGVHGELLIRPIPMGSSFREAQL